MKMRSALDAFVREASRINTSLRLEVYVVVALLAALVFLFTASSLLETPVYPEGLDASLVPVRPAVVRIINTVDRFAKRLLRVDLYPLDVQAMLAQAVNNERGLSDFGNPSFLEGLESIAQSASEEDGLTLMGQVVIRSAIVRELQVRLRLVDAFKTPAGRKALEVPVTRPVFIVGLPRTGTSIMHNMLSAGGHTRWRTPLHWELLAPVPLPDEPRSRAQQAQIDETTFELENFKELAPGVERFHPMGANVPEEDIMIFAADFHSLAYATTANTPRYLEYLNQANFTNTLVFHQQFLQHLQSARKQRGRRWLLKAPQWCQSLGQLLSFYPDAVVINTHRDPYDVLVSISSLSAKMDGIVTDRLDTAAIGQAQLNYWEEASRQMYEWRKSAGPEFNCRPGALTVHPDDHPAAAGTRCRILDVHLRQIQERSAAVRDTLRRIMNFVGADNATGAEIEAMLDFKNNFGINKHARVKKNRSVFGFPEGDFLGENSGLIQYYRRYARPWDPPLQSPPVPTNSSVSSRTPTQKDGTAKQPVPRPEVEPVVVSNGASPGAAAVDSDAQGDSASVLSTPSDNTAPIPKAVSATNQDKVAAAGTIIDDANAPIHAATNFVSNNNNNN